MDNGQNGPNGQNGQNDENNDGKKNGELKMSVIICMILIFAIIIFFAYVKDKIEETQNHLQLTSNMLTSNIIPSSQFRTGHPYDGYKPKQNIRNT